MSHKISIVMGYINRKTQLIKTLETFEKSNHNNYEVIIINDGDENLQDLEKDNIKIFKNPKKEYNPCATYNYGFLQATGDIIIIQNPECIHIGDILTKINDNLKDNDCMIFNCYFLENYEQNKLLYETKDVYEFTKNNKNKQWFPQYNNWAIHHKLNPNILHFCLAIYKKKLNKINFFDKKYNNGFCFEDDELSRKLKLSHINTYFYSKKFNDDKTFVIHQHHERQVINKEVMKKWEINKNLFIRDHKKYTNEYLNFYLNKNIISPKNININNTVKLETFIDKKEIYYTANIEQIIFKEDLNNTLNNSIFHFTCQVKNYNKKYIIVNNHKININKGSIFYTGKINNLINNELIFDSSTIKIINPKLILKDLNYQNNGTFIIDKQQWLHSDVPKIAHIYIQELNFNNFKNIKNFYDLNPDWMINIYYNKHSNLNKSFLYYDLIDNLQDIKVIELDIINIDKELIYDYVFIKTLSENNGLWFNSNNISFTKNVLNENFNYLNFNNDTYNNNLIISNNNLFYKYLSSHINIDFKGYDELMKSLFNNFNKIENNYHIKNTNHLLTFKENNINNYIKLTSIFDEQIEYLIIINDKIYYEYCANDLEGDYAIENDYLIINWNNGIKNYYIKDEKNIYVLQIFNNFNLNKYNTDNKTNFDNLQEIINLHIKLEVFDELISYCN